jgi:HPt (histidine-containing phosphotransfer) domain-containing protein
MVNLSDDSPELVLNFPELLARVDNDRELLCELLELFKEESSNLLGSLKKAVSHEDMERVQTTGHTLRGMLANLSATRAAAAASRLEEIGTGGDKSELRNALLTFESEMAILLPNVDRYLHDA